MNQTTHSMAEVVAQRLFQHYWEQHPDDYSENLPLDELVAWLGIDVATFHPDDYPAGTYGFLDTDEDAPLIWLRQELAENFRRFTLAHELGHAVLHGRGTPQLQRLLGDLFTPATQQSVYPSPSREDPCGEDDVQEEITRLYDQDQLQELLGTGAAYHPRSQRELDANVFAAELLLPIKRVRSLYLQGEVPPANLATLFGVSQAALLNRLAGLLQEPFSPTEPEPIAQRPEPQQQKPATKPRYDEFQQAAIEAPTPALIVAGPGSGKTSTLIGRVQYLVEVQRVKPQEILALTFSRKAAQEMEERLGKVLQTSLPTVSTFHSFCANLLREHSTLVDLHPDFTLLDDAEGYFLLQQQANRLRLRHYQKLHAPAYYFPDMLKAISRAKDELISPTDYAHLAQRMREQAQDDRSREEAEKAAEIAHVYALYEEELRRRGDCDFGGLLFLVVQLLRQQPEIRQQVQQSYQHILVDEFQDVNRASGVLLRELAGEVGRVWVVGDANQAIYGFRGASPANISQFTTDFPGATILPLSRNYRSLPDLVAIAEAFRCTHLEEEEQPGKNQPARLPLPEPAVTIAQASDEASELAGIIDDIRYKRRQGFAYRDMVILCRTRSQARKITSALVAADLPALESESLLEQEAIKDALSMLLLLADASGMGLLRAGQQPEHRLSQEDIEIFLLAAREQKTSPRMLLLSGEIPFTVSREGRHALQRLSDMLRSLQRVPDTWTYLVSYLLIETTRARTLLTETGKQYTVLLEQYNRLLQLARHYDQQCERRYKQQVQEAEARDEPPPPEAALDERLKGFLEYLSLLVLLRQDGSRQSAEDAEGEHADIIRVMTVHASKGLEFPVVYLPGLVQRRFPSQRRTSAVTAPDGMLSEENTGEAAHESGEACLFYVGVTRAREYLVLSYSERYGKMKYKRSHYLDALERGLPGKRVTKLYWQDRGHELPSTPVDQPTIIPSRLSERFIQSVQPQTLSASAIEAYARCPRQYAYNTLYHFGEETSTYRIFWQATQKTIEVLSKHLQSEHGYTAEQLPTQQEIRELYSQHWQELGGQAALFGPMYEEHGHEVVEHIRRELIAQEQEQWELRPRYVVDIAGQSVHVTVDRVESASSREAETTRRFVRTRYGKSKKEKPTAEMKDLFYALVYRQLHPGQPVELHSHNLSTGEMVPITISTKKEQSLYEEIEQSMRGLERHEYPALPAEPFRCPTCPFFFICPA